MTKRDGNGVWFREVGKVLKRFDASLEWLMERIELREGAMSALRKNGQLEEREKDRILGVRKTRSIEEVL